MPFPRRSPLQNIRSNLSAYGRHAAALGILLLNRPANGGQEPRRFVEERLDDFPQQLPITVDAVQSRIPVHNLPLPRPCGVPPTFIHQVDSAPSVRSGERFEEPRGANRLGNVMIHPGRQAAFAIPFHGVGRHGDDRNMPPVVSLAMHESPALLPARP